MLLKRLALQHLWWRLSVIYADGGYSGPMCRDAAATHGWRIEIVSRDPQSKGFVVLPKRWVVERTFGWFGRCRRLSKDYEYLPESGEAWIHWAMTRLMLRRLTS